MPIVSRKEFSELCGDRQDALMVYIRRNKVVLHPSDKKLLDTEDPLNKAFIEARQAFNAAKGLPPAEKQALKPEKKAKSAPETPKKPSKKATGHAEIQKKDKVYAEQVMVNQMRVDQDMQKKALEIENLELAKQQKMMQLNKAAGQLIPVDLLRGVIKRHADSINKSFEKGIETLITIMVQTLSGGDPKTHGKFLGMAKETLSKCIANAGTASENEIIILVDEFSKTLDRGQKRS